MHSNCSSTSAYVSDLPVRLINKFRPLPDYDSLTRGLDFTIRFPAIATAEEYDFTKERKAIHDFDAHLRSLAAEQESIDRKHLENSSINSSPNDGSTSTAEPSRSPPDSHESTIVERSTTFSANIAQPFKNSSTVSNTSHPPPVSIQMDPPDDPSSSASTSYHQQQPWVPLLPSTSSILQPTPASRPDQEWRSTNAYGDRFSSTMNPAQQSSNRIALSLEDFENVQSSPFDALELKTINDIEELRRISTHQQQPFLPVNPSSRNGF